MRLKRILVANRGEIALRIIKTIKEMGLEAVAMYVEIDKNSVYVQNSDHAFRLDNGYMDQDEIISECGCKYAWTALQREDVNCGCRSATCCSHAT